MEKAQRLFHLARAEWVGGRGLVFESWGSEGTRLLARLVEKSGIRDNDFVASIASDIRDAEDYKHHHTYIWQPRTEVRGWQEIKVNSGELNRRELYLYLRCRKLGAFAETKDLSAPGLAHLDL
jgi:hypothetical protein